MGQSGTGGDMKTMTADYYRNCYGALMAGDCRQYH